VASLAEAVEGAGWYHTLELPGGIVTPGYYDLRGAVRRVPLPASLAGKRCLDVGTATGFWAFEMERRGAAEVVAIDLDDATKWDWQRSAALDPETAAEGRGYVRRGFEVARSALDSKVEWRELSAYEVTPEALGGSFDFVFAGNILLHLRDPVAALERVRTVVGGELLSFEPVLFWLSLLLRRRPAGLLWSGDDARWWTPNVAAHKRWLTAAGFELTASGAFVFQRFGALWRELSPSHASLRSRLRFGLGERRLGVPSGWVLARPDGVDPR
jgi:tRNA (mo5U34)-methyltransferase